MGNSIFEYLLNKINKINLATKSVTTIDPRIELSFDFDDNNCPVYKIKIDGQDRFWVYADNYGTDTNAVRIFLDGLQAGMDFMVNRAIQDRPFRKIHNELANGIFNLNNWLNCLHLAREKYGENLPQNGKIGVHNTVTVEKIYDYLDAACKKLQKPIVDLRKIINNDSE